MKKRALVIRHGAMGDTVMATVVIPYLLKDGYEIDFMTGKTGQEILTADPRINLIQYTDNSLDVADLDNFYRIQSMDYDKSVVYTGIIEERFLYAYPSEEYYWSLPKRRKHCNGNYLEEHVRHAGYEPQGPVRPKLYHHRDDLIFSKNLRQKLKDKFIILWALAGSSLHKVYFHYNRLVKRVLEEMPDAVIIEMGSINELPLTYSVKHQRVIPFMLYNRPVSTSIALTTVGDLIIGPETGLLNAAAALPIPKICLLTHSSRENLTKTWENDFSMQSLVHCSPCHLLHKYSYLHANICPSDKEILHKFGKHYPACIGEGFPPDLVFERIREVYYMKKKGNL